MMGPPTTGVSTLRARDASGGIAGQARLALTTPGGTAIHVNPVARSTGRAMYA